LPPEAAFRAHGRRQKLIHDPRIASADNVYHAVWYEQGIGIAHSRDLITWSEAAFLPVMVHERKAANAWAPEIFFDEDTGQYLIFWATTIPGRFRPQTGRQPEKESWPSHITSDRFKNYSRANCSSTPIAVSHIAKEPFVMFLKDDLPGSKTSTAISTMPRPYVLAPSISG
jgi:hypothetical protein